MEDCVCFFGFYDYVITRIMYILGMDGGAENNLRQEEAGGADAGLRERAGDLQQQVSQ